MSAHTEPRREAQAPFDKRTADLILRAADNVIFRVRKGILAEASTFFENMFADAQPVTELSSPNEMIDGVPVIDMEESSRVVEYILRIYYPVDKINLETREDVLAAVGVCRKFMLDYALKHAQEQFMRFVSNEGAIRMYALAAQEGWEEEMKMAAKASLLSVIDHSQRIDELRSISGLTYAYLLDYHDRCSMAMDNLVYSGGPGVIQYPWIKTYSRPWINSTARVATVTVIMNKISVRVPSWWTDYMTEAIALLKTRPHSSTIYTATLSDKLYRNVYMQFPSARRDVLEFEKELADAVDELISKVELKLA